MKIMFFRNSSIVALIFFSLSLPFSTDAATLNFTGSGVLEPGSVGAANAMIAGTVVRYSNVGVDDSGTSFDGLLTTVSIGSGDILNAASADAFVHATGPADSWGEFSLQFVQTGTIVPVVLTGVTNFIAQDIDSSSNSSANSDVFGLANAPGAAVHGSLVETGGFLNDATAPAGYDYTRLRDADGSGNFLGEGGVGAADATNWATYDYLGASISQIDFVWGYTVSPGFNVNNNRGMFAELNFEGTVPAVPEPGSASLVGLAALFLLARRKR